jgi:hypothetical protein
MREGNAVLVRVVTDVEVSRQSIRLRREVMVVEHEREARIRRERLTAGARRQIHALRFRGMAPMALTQSRHSFR